MKATEDFLVYLNTFPLCIERFQWRELPVVLLECLISFDLKGRLRRNIILHSQCCKINVVKDGWKGKEKKPQQPRCHWTKNPSKWTQSLAFVLCDKGDSQHSLLETNVSAVVTGMYGQWFRELETWQPLWSAHFDNFSATIVWDVSWRKYIINYFSNTFYWYALQENNKIYPRQLSLSNNHQLWLDVWKDSLNNKQMNRRSNRRNILIVTNTSVSWCQTWHTKKTKDESL